MTTIVVVKKNGMAVIAGDSLTTFGSTRLSSTHDASPDKILKHNGSYFGVAGSAAHQVVLENLLNRNPDFNFHGKEQIYESFRKMHPLLKEEAFLNPKEEEDDPYESSQLTTLIINGAGIFGVYSMREVFEFQTFWSIGSGRDFALGAMNQVYQNKKATAEEVARAGILAGAEFDTGTSLPMTLYKVKLGTPAPAKPAASKTAAAKAGNGKAEKSGKADAADADTPAKSARSTRSTRSTKGTRA